MQVSKHTNRFEEATEELMAERDRLFSEFGGEADFPAETLLDHMYANPLGNLLRIISTLPEVRHDKVDQARQMLQETEDELDFRMDLALDKVLEELITEN